MRILFSVLLLFNPAFAEDEWSACPKLSECVVVEDACHSPLAINKKFLKQNDEKNRKLRPLIQCLRYEGPPIETFKADCVGKKCILKQKEQTK